MFNNFWSYIRTIFAKARFAKVDKVDVKGKAKKTKKTYKS